MSKDVLIVDDESDIRELIAGILADDGFDTRMASCSDTALREIQKRTPSAVILDIWLQSSRLDGLALLDVLREQDPGLPVIIISGHGNIDTAVSAIRRGAYDYIEKPFNAERLLLVLERALEAAAMRHKLSDLEQCSTGAMRLIGQSQPINLLRQNIERVSATSSRVMIFGPSGSGKELAARMIHEHSPRARARFVRVNASTIAPDNFDAELFGEENRQGRVRKIGAFEAAHGGTLYLDEITDLPLRTQAKILRVLVGKVFTRVNGVKEVQVDVRIVASTSRDARTAISEHILREDLLQRLAVIPLHVPPLSERREDIPQLVDFFVNQVSVSAGIAARHIDDNVMAIFQAHDWPGNVRQLRNNVERLMILTRGESREKFVERVLSDNIGDDASAVAANGGHQNLLTMSLRNAREAFERDYLQTQIKRFNGNISKTASFVGMERSALHRKLKALGI